MKSKPFVSVIMLNYNGLKYLKKTIPPILDLQYPNYEFIVVDNGSIDGSIKFIKKFKKVRLIENRKNLGLSKGKNEGVRIANGEYILLLDNDVLIRSNNILKRLVKFYEKNKKIAFVNVPLLDREDITIKKTKQYGSYYGIFGIKENSYIDYDSIKNFSDSFETAVSFGGNLFIKKFIWNELGGLDESQPFNLDDDDISIRAGIFGYTNFTYTQDYFIHLGKENKINNSFYRWKYKYYFSGKAKAIIKNFQVTTIIPIFLLFFFKTILKTIKETLLRLDPKLFSSLFYSLVIFTRDLPSTLKKRKIIQINRKKKDCSIIRIKAPKFTEND